MAIDCAGIKGQTGVTVNRIACFGGCTGRVMTTELPYLKMNGLGNDFIVLDARAQALAIDPDAAARLGNRETGIGCDQLIVLEPSSRADLFMRIRNGGDGAEAEACGNATRCIAGLIAEETGRTEATIETVAGLLKARVNPDGTVIVDMGQPRLRWDEIPLSEEFADTRYIELEVGPRGAPILHSPSVANIGNPHCIFWVDDSPGNYDLATLGPFLENHPYFPERANISIAQLTGPDQITMRVWERAAGLTEACGSAACAAAVSAARKRLTGRKVVVTLPGGPLTIEWRDADDHILMTGAWELDGRFTLDPEAYGIGVT